MLTVIPTETFNTELESGLGLFVVFKRSVYMKSTCIGVCWIPNVSKLVTFFSPLNQSQYSHSSGQTCNHCLCNIPCISLGLGLALNFQPSLIMLNRYFSEKRPLANGLAAAGSPVALCCLSPLGQVLQYQYGWRGGFLLLGGLLLNCCVCGALMRPLLPQKTQKLDESSPAAPEKEKKPQSEKKLLDLSVFKDRGFVIYAFAASVMVLGLFVPPVFVVNYAKSLGYEDTKSALLLTILGFVDMFARPASGLITGMKCVRPWSVYLLSFAIIFNGLTDIIGSQVKMQHCVLYCKENGRIMAVCYNYALQ